MECIRGTVDVLILKTLSWGPLHGYGISRWLREHSGDEFELSQGALYPALRRLEAGGHLESHWEVSATGRDTKVYRLTSSGRDHLVQSVRNWARYVELMDGIPWQAEALP